MGEEKNQLFSFGQISCLSLQKTTMLRGALGLGGPASPRRNGQQQNGNGNGSPINGGGGGRSSELAAVLDADDGVAASPRGAAGASGAGAGSVEEDLAATAAGE